MGEECVTMNGERPKLRSSSVVRQSSWICCLIWLGLGVVSFLGSRGLVFGGAAWGASLTRVAGESSCLACHRKESGRPGKIVQIHEGSTHGKLGVECNGCHGGDSNEMDKSKAHAGTDAAPFIGKPDPLATLAMCGRCHTQPLALFKTSRHFQAQRGVPRLDCAECHGAHSVGAPPASFSFSAFCAGCHGLEYLPALPPPFQEMLTLSDDLREAVRQVEEAGRTPSSALIRRRKEIRHLTSEIVHPADVKGGLEKIPHVLQLGKTLKQQIELEKNKKP